MKSYFKMSICLWCLTVGSASCCFGKEWRGIVPLHSTRADVIKLLGVPQHVQWDYRDYFEIENGIVTFQWVDPNCLRKYPVEPDAAIRPDDLVLNISIRLKTPVPVSELRLPENKIYFTDCLGNRPNDPWSCTFADSKDGFAYGSSNGGVTSLSYYATAKDFEAWQKDHTACVYSRG